MALKILSSPSTPDAILDELRSSIEAAIPGARAEVSSARPGHFEIRVTAEAFDGKSRVRQQQLVYGAITHLMKGNAPPVHAVDQLVTLIP